MRTRDVLKRFIGFTCYAQTKTGTGNVGNSTFAAPAMSKLWLRET